MVVRPNALAGLIRLIGCRMDEDRGSEAVCGMAWTTCRTRTGSMNRDSRIADTDFQIGRRILRSRSVTRRGGWEWIGNGSADEVVVVVVDDEDKTIDRWSTRKGVGMQ